uniref:Ig-like domain-containing protein n=1 Tax=Paramormyrops kingsleyae TaxID=1676925 RepID=A0A3B3T0E5_9TELE
PVFTQKLSAIVYPLNSDDIKSLSTVQWMFNGSALIRRPEASLHSGMYRCKTTNVFSTVVSWEAKKQFACDNKPRITVSGGLVVVLLSGHYITLKNHILLKFQQPRSLRQDTRRFISQETGSLYMAKIEASDMGNYTCAVGNVITKDGPLASTAGPPQGFVMGEYEPKIEVQFGETVSVVKGSTGLFGSARSSPVPILAWGRADTLLGKIQINHPYGTLEIPSFRLEDNSRGQALTRGQLIFYGTVSQHAMRHGYLWATHCSCKVDGSTTVSQQLWVNMDTIEIVCGRSSSTKLQLTDSGIFQCLEQDMHGVLYARDELKVVGKSHFPLKKITLVQRGGEVAIQCHPHDLSTFHSDMKGAGSSGSKTEKKKIYWVGDSIVLPCEVSKDNTLDSAFKCFFTGKLINFRVCIDVMIRNVQLKYAGKCISLVHTVLDSVSAAAGLIVQRPPGAPDGLVVNEVTASNSHAPVASYTVQAHSWAVPGTIRGLTFQATVTDLNSWVDCEFQMAANAVYSVQCTAQCPHHAAEHPSSRCSW